MEKFSLYDLLGLLLPGALFLFFTNVIFSFMEIDYTRFTASDRILDIGLTFCMTIFAGALFYAGNFYLVKKKWFNALFGMNKGVIELFMSFKSLYETLRPALNSKAVTWYDKGIFQSLTQLNDMKKTKPDKTAELQDDFYDRMYYELEYHKKIESPKTMQSFYFFFRQTALACAILIIFIAILLSFSFLNLKGFAALTQDFLVIAFLISIILLISVKLARWFRKRMVLKMYWMFFTHINNS